MKNCKKNQSPDENNLTILLVTSEWPTKENPTHVPFIVQQVNFLRDAGINIDVFSFRGAKNPWNYLKARSRLQKILANRHYDLVHAQFGQSALLSLFPKNKPIVVSLLGSDVEGIIGENGKYTISGKILQYLTRYVSKKADEVILVSEHMKRTLPKRNYHVIPNGVDLEMFHPSDKLAACKVLGLSTDEILVLFGGRPSMAVKRLALAESAINLISHRFKNIKLVLLNDVPHHIIPTYMNACDVLLLTSKHEGSPNIIKEAIACNLPIVSTDVGDVRERISSIDGCILCEKDDALTIANALTQIIIRRQRIDGSDVVNEFNDRLLTQKVIRIYKKILDKINFE